MSRTHSRRCASTLLALLLSASAATPSQPPEPAPEPSSEVAQDPLALAVESLRRGELEAALPLLERVGPDHPGYPLALHNLGVLHERLGRLEDSAASFEQLLELGDQDPDALIGLAWARYRLNQPDAARSALRRALALRPSDGQARYNLALVELTAGREQAALAQLKTALGYEPATRLAGEALLDLEALAVARPGLEGLDTLRQLLLTAGVGTSEGDPVATLAAAEARLSSAPDDVKLLSERLDALEQLAARAPRSVDLERRIDSARSELERARTDGL